MKKPPILYLVADDPVVLEKLEGDLARRFANDCRIRSARSPGAALTELEALAADAEPLALLIADHRMATMGGIELLAKAHVLHPSAKRILLVERDYTADNPIVPAMTRGEGATAVQLIHQYLAREVLGSARPRDAVGPSL